MIGGIGKNASTPTHPQANGEGSPSPQAQEALQTPGGLQPLPASMSSVPQLRPIRAALLGMPSEILQSVASHLRGEDLLALRASSSTLRHTMLDSDWLRGLQPERLRRALHAALEAQDCVASRLPDVGLGVRFNHHSFLADVGAAFGQPRPQRVAPRMVTSLSEDELRAFNSFVANIAELPVHEQLDKDDQASAIALSRALFGHCRDRMTPGQRMDLAMSICELPAQVGNARHSHSLASEAGRAAEKSVELFIERGGPLHQLTWGVTAAPAVVATAIGTVAATAVNMAKDDKTANKALKFLSEVMDSFARNALQDRLVDRVTQLLIDMPDPSKSKVVSLTRKLKELATDQQRAAIVAALGNAGRPQLAAA